MNALGQVVLIYQPMQRLMAVEDNSYLLWVCTTHLENVRYIENISTVS